MNRTKAAPIALTGGTGFLGGTVLEMACAGGIAVNALTRRPQPDRQGVSWIDGDLADSVALARLVTGTQAVIHVAGAVNAPDRQGFEQANVAGTGAVLAAARAAGVQRFIFISSLSAREPALSAYGASKARAEALVQASGLAWTIVRPPAIFGPRDGEMLDLFRAARRGVVPVPRTTGRAGEGRLSVIYAEDLARLLLALIPGGATVQNRIFEPDDGRAHGWSHGEFARAIGASVGRRVLVARLPGIAMRLAARLDHAWRGQRAKLTLDRVSYMMHPDWVISEQARPPAGLWAPSVPTPDGLARTVRWYQEQGWL